MFDSPGGDDCRVQVFPMRMGNFRLGSSQSGRILIARCCLFRFGLRRLLPLQLRNSLLDDVSQFSQGWIIGTDSYTPFDTLERTAEHFRELAGPGHDFLYLSRS